MFGRNKEEELFQILFLRNDKTQSVDVQELQDINAKEIKKRLGQGDSVFITCKSAPKFHPKARTAKDSRKTSLKKPAILTLAHS